DGEFTRPERINRHYRSNRFDKSLSPGTFVFRPTMDAPGAEPNLLWHPVKDQGHRTWSDALAPKTELGRIFRKLIKRLQN
ncbi:MAG: hypothetical protein WBR56_05160, partial [Sedimenticolaceae bacterium]